MIRGVNVHRFCEGLGVRVEPPRRARRERAPNVTHAIGTLRGLLADHGEAHARLVVMCIQAADPTILMSDVLRAVSIVLLNHPDRFQTRGEAVAWFGGIPLPSLRERAQRLYAGPQALAALIADRLIDYEPQSRQQAA